MLKIKRTIIFGILLLLVVVSNAQQSRVTAAYTFLQQNKLDSAKANIDAAVVFPETQVDGQAWYIRGFVYKTIYNQNEKGNKESFSRIEALISFKKSLALDTTQENVHENIKNIKYLATTLYNDAAASLDTIDFKIAIRDFDTFREYYLLVDPSKENFKQKEIDFANAIAAVYTRIYDGDKKGKIDFLALAKASYNKALELDPNNISANYNMGILYYNQAVNLINQSDYDLDIVALNDVQDNSINLFKASLPFMEKAYSLDPNKRETLLGLSGIYFSLNEKEKSNEFKQKLEKIGK
ncbi:MAG: tetratricopeptide repeat protein [Bacteroidetes bacterium]|nr:tetratricopeptide repeat protein [Bacteroidota bacterium]